MSLSVFVNGVDRTAKWQLPLASAGEASFERRPNGQSPGQFVFYDRVGVGGFRPTDGQPFELKDGGTSVYKGQILDVDEDGLSDLDTGVVTTVTTVDNQALPLRQTYTKTYAKGAYTHKQILQDLVAGPLAPYAITLDPAQAVGAASFEELAYVDASVETILNDQQKLTGWIWRITPGLVLRSIAPASESSGLSLGDAAGSVQGKVGLRKRRSANYGNTVSLRCGPAGTALASQEWIADGVATSWVTDIAAADPPPPLVLVDDGVSPFMATVGAGAMFEWNTSTHTLSVGTYGTPAAGVRLKLGPTLASGDPFEVNGYTAQYPFYVVVSDAPTVAVEGPWVHPEAREDIVNYGAGVAYATAVLRVVLATPWVVTVRHRAGLAWPGQTVALSFAEREVLGTYMILSVAAETDVDGELVYTFECLEGDELQPTWVDYFKELAGGGGGGGSVSSGIGVGGGTTAVLSSPFPLGGSRSDSLAVGTASTPVINWLPFVAAADQSVRVRVTTRSRVGGVGVIPILERYDSGSMTWVAHATGATATGTTEQEQTIPTALTLGQVYRLAYKTNTANASAYAIGQLETL